jgi:hypothetical protein
MHIPLYVLHSVSSNTPLPLFYPHEKCCPRRGWIILKESHTFLLLSFLAPPHHPYARMGRLHLLYREKKDKERVKEGWHADWQTGRLADWQIGRCSCRGGGGGGWVGANLDDDKASWSLTI